MMEVAYVAAAIAMKGDDRRVFWRNLGWWTLAAWWRRPCCGSRSAAGIAQGSILVAIVGPLVVTVAHLAQSLVYVALRTEAFRGELDREWLARLNAEKVVPALLWAIFAAICLLLPPLVFDQWHSLYTTVIGLATGPVSALLGKYSPVVRPQPGAPGARIAVSFRVLADLTAAIFAVALFTVFGARGAAAHERQRRGRVRADRDRRRAVLVVWSAHQRQPLLAARGLSQSAGACVPGIGAARADAGSVHRLRPAGQSAHGRPRQDREPAQAVPGDQRHPQRDRGRAQRLERAQGRKLHHHAQCLRRGLPAAAGRCRCRLRGARRLRPDLLLCRQ